MADYRLNQPGATIQEAIDIALEIQGDLADEIAAREAADALLATKTELQSEANTRQTADAEKASLTQLANETNRAQAAESALGDRIDAIGAKIPSEASSSNQLADKNFVNSSIGTSTANYISNNGYPFTSVAQLNAYTGPHDNNDYAFVVSTDAAGNTVYSRYKYNGSTWAKEYDLNNSSFTADQWAAINSFMTSVKTQKLDALPTASELATLFSGKQDVISDLTTIRAQAAAAYVKPSGGIPASDIAEGVIPDVSGKVNTSDIADNLTTNDATKVLSAKQGKVLNENLTQLGQELSSEISDLELEIDGEALVPRLLVWADGYVNGNGILVSSDVAKFSQPVLLKEGEKIVYKSSEEFSNAVVSVADDTPISIGDTLSYTNLITYYPNKAGTTVEYTANSDAWIVISISKSNYTLQFVAYKDGSVKDQLAATNAKIDREIDKVTAHINVSPGKYYKSNGDIANSDDFATQDDYTPISNGDTIKFLVGTGIPSSSSWAKAVIYDSSKAFLTYVSGYNNRELTLSAEGAAYIRASYTNDASQNQGLIINGVRAFTAHFAPGDILSATQATKAEIEKEIEYSNNTAGYKLKKYSNATEAVAEGGKLIADANFGVSDYIPFATLNKSITVKYGPHNDNNFACIYFYDANKKLLNFYGAVNAQYRDLSITVDAQYIRISYNLSYADAGVLYNGAYIWQPKQSSDYYKGLFDIIKQTDGDIDALRSVANNARRDLITACRYGYGNITDENNNTKDMQALIMTDTHTFAKQVSDHIELCDGIETIDMMLLCGDYCYTRWNPTEASAFMAQVAKLRKPLVLCIGNHDAGFHYYCGNSATHKELYDAFIAPLVASGNITHYTANVPYYYYDNDTYGIRVISVYEYDGDLAVDETHWELVTYDSTKPMISKTETYYAGDIVNVPLYTTGSFKAKETIDMTGASEYNKDKYPSYKIQRDTRVIREAQANWLANTLAGTPAGYKVVILTHQHFSSNSATQTDKKFCIDQEYASGLVSEAMQTDLLADMVDAFMNKQNFVEKVVMKGDAAYMNTIPDGQGGYYAYEITKDFSQVNDNVGFLCYINGHHHRDMIWKHNIYEHQWGISCGQTGYYYQYDADIRRSREDIASRDSITSISFDKSNNIIRLVKIGNQRTIDGELRDYEKLSL